MQKREKGKGLEERNSVEKIYSMQWEILDVKEDRTSRKDEKVRMPWRIEEK